MKKLAVIIPIYNVENFLDECLLSFVNQTSKDFHTYLIDDGSKDKSGDLAKKYAEKYPDLFEYHYQENKGLGGARNTGLSLAKEPYVWFFDSDDFTAVKTIENIVNYLSNHNPDILMLMPVIYDMQSTSYEDWHDKEIVECIYQNNNPSINVGIEPGLLSTETSVCRSIWRKEFLDKLSFKFEEKVKWEDVYPHFYLFSKAESIEYLPILGSYYYRVNTGKQITAGSGKTRLDMIHLFFEVIDLAKKDMWTSKMYAHLIRTMQNYFLWSLDLISLRYRKEYVKGMHKVYRKIPCKYFKEYKNLAEPYSHFKKQHIFADILRNSLSFRLLYNNRFKDFVKRIINKLKKIVKG